MLDHANAPTTAGSFTRLGLDFTANYSPFRVRQAIEAIELVAEQIPGLDIEVRVDPGGFHPSVDEDGAGVAEALGRLAARPGVELLHATAHQDDLERWLFRLDLLVLPAPSEANHTLVELGWIYNTKLIVPSFTPDANSVVARFPYIVGDDRPFEATALAALVIEAIAQALAAKPQLAEPVGA